MRVDGVTPVLADHIMRELGFTDHREGFWYFCETVCCDETINFTITKSTGQFEELVMDEIFGQPAFYGRMAPEFHNKIRAKVNTITRGLNSAGLTLAVDHAQYGSHGSTDDE